MFKKTKKISSRHPRQYDRVTSSKYSYSSVRKDSKKLTNRDEHSQDRNSSDKSLVLSSLYRTSIGIVFLLSVGYLTLLDSNPIVRVVSGAGLIRDESVYQKQIADKINSSILNKNKLTFNVESITGDIHNQFPELQKIDISIPLVRHRPTVLVEVAKPAAILVTVSGNYLVDSDGNALSLVSDSNINLASSNLVSINDPSGHKINLGKPALTSLQIMWINQLIQQSIYASKPIESLTLNSAGTGIDARYQGKSYNVKFSFYTEVRRSAGAYFAVADRINTAKVEQPKEYIDLRIEDRAYIK